ncbi:MAG: hypothetical protein H8E05_01375 [Bacteroidetes bacterium]|nr:hypothetical protein [Bacteroidota bacterium]
MEHKFITVDVKNSFQETPDGTHPESINTKYIVKMEGDVDHTNIHLLDGEVIKTLQSYRQTHEQVTGRILFQ